MAKDDIYGNKRRYERYIAELEELAEPAQLVKSGRRGHVRKYYCKNPRNLNYFLRLHDLFESRDTSFVRRLRLFCTLLFVVHMTELDLKELRRKDIDRILKGAHKVNKTIESKKTFVWNLKYLWKVLLPEVDAQGRQDETVIPYEVRHVKAAVDRSQQTLRNDRLSWEEYERIVEYFSDHPQMQAFVTLAMESLGRPQELCFRTLGDVEIHESHAKIWVSSHGKEGVKLLQCIDSFPYLMRWLQKHPFKEDPEAYLFMANRKRDCPVKPSGINKYLQKATLALNIEKRITAYSIKRNGITFSRLRGDPDIDIQRRAGWTSTRQLQTYDLSTYQDAFQRELAKRGLVQGETTEGAKALPKKCVCGMEVGFSEKVCVRCLRVTDEKLLHGERYAELQMKKVFALALENPKASFQELVESVSKSSTE